MDAIASCLRLILLLPLWFIFSPVHAVDVAAINFESAVYPPSAFKLRQAKQKGIELEIDKGLIISGRLRKPSGVGPFPAIVLLHGCDGMGAWNDAWGQRLMTWGYVVLDVDSFTARREETICDSTYKVSGSSRAMDAHGAKDYLLALEFVDPNRIGVVGMSHGGWSVLSAVSNETVSMFEAFQAGVAFYPGCDDLRDLNAPLLILIGGKDDWISASLCKERSSTAKSDHEVTLQVYPDAYHVFDLEGIDEQVLGHIHRYDADAANDAIIKAQQFLGKYLQQSD